MPSFEAVKSNRWDNSLVCDPLNLYICLAVLHMNPMQKDKMCCWWVACILLHRKIAHQDNSAIMHMFMSCVLTPVFENPCYQSMQSALLDASYKLYRMRKAADWHISLEFVLDVRFPYSEIVKGFAGLLCWLYLLCSYNYQKQATAAGVFCCVVASFGGRPCAFARLLSSSLSSS